MSRTDIVDEAERRVRECEREIESDREQSSACRLRTL